MEAPFLVGAETRVHPSAHIESGVVIGSQSSVWNNTHIRHDTHIGNECIIGEKTYIAYSVKIGNRVKINSYAYLCTGLTIEDGVMISAGVIFTNDRYPRAAATDLKTLRPSDPDETTLQTTVRRGATIGARAAIGAGLEIGQFSMIGMGAVVTKNIPAFYLVFGNPAEYRGIVCRCGAVLYRFKNQPPEDIPLLNCQSCSLTYRLTDGQIVELSPPED